MQTGTKLAGQEKILSGSFVPAFFTLVLQKADFSFYMVMLL